MPGIDSYAKLVLHGDGSDASTTIVDSSLSPKTVTPVDNAQLDTAQQKFGTASILFDGAGDYLTVPDSDDWNFGSGDFTVDGWVRFIALPNLIAPIFAHIETVDTDYQEWRLIRNETSYYLQHIVYSSGSVVIAEGPQWVGVAINTWYHIALVRQGNLFSTYVDGTLIGTAGTDTDTIRDYSGLLYLGYHGNNYYLNGWIDELRISKGIARWTDNFTPPTEAYAEVLGGTTYDVEITENLTLADVIETVRMFSASITENLTIADVVSTLRDVFTPSSLEVSLANMRLSLVNGSAFADFSSANKLTPFLKGILKVKNKTPLSYYPPVQNSTYIRSYSLSTDYYNYFATDPTKSLIGSQLGNSWIAIAGGTNKRFHIDFGSLKVINRIYYENFHNGGTGSTYGIRHFTFWGSNDANAFAELTYEIDTNWTQLFCSTTEFDQHVALDQVDPKYIDVTNTTTYRYYAFKFADNWGNEPYMGVRRIELQNHRSIEGFINAAATQGYYENRGVDGIWYSPDNINWTLSNGTEPLIVVNSGMVGYASFTTYGIYESDDGISWANKTSNIPTIMVVSKSELFASFSGAGVYSHSHGVDNTTWTLIGSAGLTATEMVICDDILYCKFTGLGENVYRYGGVIGDWTQIFTGIPQANTLPETGVSIVSTRGGTVQNWTSIETGFLINDPLEFTAQIEEDIRLNLQASIAETLTLADTISQNMIYSPSITETLTLDDDVDAEFNIFLFGDNQVFPLFSNSGFTGWISNDQETPKFDVSGILIISPMLSASATAPTFSSTGNMVAGIIMNGSATYSGFSSTGNEIGDVIMTHAANFPVFKGAGQLSIGGRFTNYILRYIR